MEKNGLHQHRQHLKLKLWCFLPGWEKKRLCLKKVKKNKLAVFQFFIFLSIYKKSSEFWIKVNFSEKESYWVSRLVARCRVTLHAWRASKALRSLKIDVYFFVKMHCMYTWLRPSEWGQVSLRTATKSGFGCTCSVSNN